MIHCNWPTVISAQNFRIYGNACDKGIGCDKILCHENLLYGCDILIRILLTVSVHVAHADMF